MGSSENVRKICESLQALGYKCASDKILDALMHSVDDPLAIVSLGLNTAVTAEKNAKYESCLKRSKLGNPVFLRDLLTYKVRQLDVEYIHRLGSLNFVHEGKNLVIWGAPGTGKTWMGKAIATKACQEGIRTRWVTYPFLCRELLRLKVEDSQRLESRIKYYCGFGLLCIDEFPNYDKEHDSVMILPQKASLPSSIHQYIFQEDLELKNPQGYFKLINYVKKIAKQESVDVIHFLSFDPLVKYFGVFLNALRQYRVIVTFHHYRYSRLHDIARKNIYKHCTYGVVHTKHLQDYSIQIGIRNCFHIEYPVFKDHGIVDRKEAKQFWNIPNNETKVLLAIGGTRYNKGLDFLLEALKKVDYPFYLIIAGKEEYYDSEYIQDNIITYKDNVRLKLSYLSDEEVQTAIVASDYIVLPYRKEFDGASGPLGEGVITGKCIIGPDHGSLGQIITSNHLGYIFESENIEMLKECIQKALNTVFLLDDKYKSYQALIAPDTFCTCYKRLYDGNIREIYDSLWRQ